MSIDFFHMRIWRNWQTHKVESLDLRVLVGSTPTIRTEDMEMNEISGTERCSFTFTKDGIEIPCCREPAMELDGKKFCKLHGEVYVLENFDVKKNIKRDVGGTG
jgi:hypothetical protein